MNIMIKRKIDQIISKDVKGFSVDNLIKMMTKHENDIEQLKIDIENLKLKLNDETTNKN